MIIEVENKTYEYNKENPTNILAILNHSPFRLYKVNKNWVYHIVDNGNIDSILIVDGGFVIQDIKQQRSVMFMVDDIDCIAVYTDVVEIYYHKHITYTQFEGIIK